MQRRSRLQFIRRVFCFLEDVFFGRFVPFQTDVGMAARSLEHLDVVDRSELFVLITSPCVYII